MLHVWDASGKIGLTLLVLRSWPQSTFVDLYGAIYELDLKLNEISLEAWCTCLPQLLYGGGGLVGILQLVVESLFEHLTFSVNISMVFKLILQVCFVMPKPFHVYVRIVFAPHDVLRYFFFQSIHI